MHSLAPYTIRTFDPNYFRLRNDYPPLDKIMGRFDMYDVFKNFFQELGSGFHIIDDEQKIYRVLSLQVDDTSRIIKGYVEQGHYGLKSDIINIDTGDVDYAKTEKNAELIKYYFYLKVPVTYNEGLALFQVYKNSSVKTLIYNLFANFYKNRVDLNVQFNSLSDDKAFEKWKNAQVKELKITKFSGIDDRADRISNLGHKEEIETALSIKPKKGSFGVLSLFLSEDTEQSRAVEVWETECQQVKTVVSLNGKNRTFSVGRGQTKALCEIEAPDDIKLEGGLPTIEALETWFNEIDQELSERLYNP